MAKEEKTAKTTTDDFMGTAETKTKRKYTKRIDKTATVVRTKRKLNKIDFVLPRDPKAAFELGRILAQYN